MNQRAHVLSELINLEPMMVQDVFGPSATATVLEVYSPVLKKMYVVFDRRPELKTLHVQTKRPVGAKTKSPLVLALKKYARNKMLQFHECDQEGVIAAPLGKDCLLVVSLFHKVAMTLFKDGAPIASSGDSLALPEYHPRLRTNVGLHANLAQATRYQEQAAQFHERSLRQMLMGQKKAELKKQRTLLKNLLADRDGCWQALLKQEDATLLKSNYNLLRRGMSSVTVMDWTKEPPCSRLIALDPKVGPKENLDLLFNKIKRARRGLVHIEPRIAAINDKIIHSEKVLDELQDGPLNMFDIEQLVVKKPVVTKKVMPRLPYHEFVSRGGRTIWVGRSAKDSDHMSFHVVNGNDWWFHARDVTGAHVVARGGAPLDEETLIDACLLAAHFSKARHDTHAIIQYTQAKHIKKHKNMAPGAVLVSQEKTFDVKIEQSLLSRLLEQGSKN